MLSSAWILAGVLALAPAGPAEGDGGSEAAEPARPEGEPSPEPPAAGTGRLVLGPDHQGTLSVRDASDREVATVALRPDRRTVVEVPPGRYTLHDDAGQTVASVEVEADQVRAVPLPEALRVDPPPVALRDRAPGGPVVTTGRLTEDRVGPPTAEAQQEVELVRRRPWARWAAPLLSAVVPGGGQALNGQPGRGLAVFTGTAGLVLGTIAVAAARDPTAGASGQASGRDAEAVVRLGALAGLSTAAGLLYLGQILDAHARAVDRRPPRPLRDHAVALEVSRFTTVAFAPGNPRYQLHSDWSLAIMGQLYPRVSFGLSDLSIKYARHRTTVTVQAGARAAYRFFESRRVWLAAGGGVLLQGTRADPALLPLVEDPDAPRPDAERGFSAVPYVHFDARLFLLDRWSLGLQPRVSLPLAVRRTQGARALPRYATTFELGANLGVYF